MDKMNRKQWLEERKKGIGGSEASAVLGANPYMTNIQLFEIKTGKLEPEDISDKPYVKYGNDAEPLLRDLFALDYPQFEVDHVPYRNLVHKDHYFLRYSDDGLLTCKEDVKFEDVQLVAGERGVLEIKTTEILQSMHRERWNDQIPDNYFIQVLQRLLVTGFSFAILKAQLKTKYGDGEVRLNTRHYVINRSDHLEDIEHLMRKEIEFWNKYVLKNECPPRALPSL